MKITQGGVPSVALKPAHQEVSIDEIKPRAVLLAQNGERTDKTIVEFFVQNNTKLYITYSPEMNVLTRQMTSYGIEAIASAKPYVLDKDLMQIKIYVEQLFYSRNSNQDPELFMQIFIQGDRVNYYWKGPINEEWKQAQMLFDLYNEMLLKNVEEES